MRRWSRFVLPVCAAPLLSSCYFLLDYNDLTSERDEPLPGAGGAAEGGAASTAGGEGAVGGAACGSCEDDDPCTVDSCDTSGDAPECVHTAIEGLALDGVDATLEAEQHVRVSLVGSGQYFYLSELEYNSDVPSVALYRLATDGDALQTVTTDLGIEGTPLSNIGLAVEELAAGEVALHGFMAFKPRLATAAPRVAHIVHRGGKTMSNVAALTSTYDTELPTTFPQALAIGDEIVGAWIQADGTIAVHSVGSAKTDTFGVPPLTGAMRSTLPANTLALLSTADDQPAVMFTAQTAAGAVGTYVETSGQNRTKVTECETRPGGYISSSVINTQIPGLWLASITRAGDGYLTSGSASLLCGNNLCTAVPEDCAEANPSNLVREVAGATIHFDNDAAGIVYSVAALPQLLPKEGVADTVVGRLSLGLSRVDFSGELKDTSSTNVGDLKPIAENDTTEDRGFQGPDWPAVAILPSGRVAVAWIQPNPDFDGTELRVQRYKMCLPSP